MVNRTENKISLEVTFGDKQAVVRILSLSWLSDELIAQAINNIIEKNKIKYSDVISKDNHFPLRYPEIIKLIEDEMLKDDIEMYIYYFRKAMKPFEKHKLHISNIFYIIFIVLMLIGLFAALLAGFVTIFKT